MMKTGVLSILIAELILSSSASYHGSSYYCGYEFAFYLDSIDFLEATVRCQSHSNAGWLAEPKDPSLQYGVELAMSGYDGDVMVWLGATDLVTEGEWFWLDNTKMLWNNWDHNEPNDSQGEDCLEMYTTTGLWNDVYCCTKRGGYVCQIPNGERYRYGHSEFEIIQSPGNFWQAKQVCARIETRLVEVADQASETELRRRLKFGDELFWIAGTMNDTSRCLAMNKDSVEECDCSASKPAFICEKIRPHALKVSQENVSVSVGSRVEVTCTADGYPTPDLVWYKDGEEVSTQIKSLGKSILVIESVKPIDAGRYLCYATNNVNNGKFEVKTSTAVMMEE